MKLYMPIKPDPVDFVNKFITLFIPFNTATPTRLLSVVIGSEICHLPTIGSNPSTVLIESPINKKHSYKYWY